jgi:hypothetical protein
MKTKDLSLGRMAFRYASFTTAALAAFEVLTAYVNFGVIGSPDVLDVFILSLGIIGPSGSATAV